MTADRRRRLSPHVVAALAVAWLAADAFARAGGGGNFGGGGGGDDGDGDGLFWLVWLCFRYPVIGIPVLIVVVIVLVNRGRAMKQGHEARVIQGGRVAAASNVQGDLASRLAERDPTFDAAAFRVRVETAFRKAQAAWCAQDLTSIRPFVSDGVHERFSMQIEEQRALGYRDQLDSLAVGSSSIVHVDLEGAYETVVVRIVATADDYRVALDTGRRVSGDGGPGTFYEFWTFLRRRGARAKAAAGLMEGNCPNCGDALEGNQFADCRSCKARLRSGEFDWVLVEITQGGEWAPPRPGEAPGVAGLASKDPEFCVAAMEDRASVAFWRWATAMRLGDARPLAGVATDDVVRDVAASLVLHEGARRYVGEVGVGGVELLGVVSDGAIDEAVVEVRWSGTQWEARAGGPRRLDRTGVMSWLLVFDRAAGAKSAPGHGFSSAHCRGCGAPSEGTSAVCGYCGAALADVNLGWTLARMATRHDAAGRVLLDRLRGAPGVKSEATAAPPALVPAQVLAWAARVAASDGVVDARETETFLRLAERAGVAPSRAREILAEAAAPGGDLPLPTSAEAARAWLESAARAALADGVLTPEEFALLMRLGGPARMSAADVRVLVNRVKAQMFQEAKAEIARARRG